MGGDLDTVCVTPPVRQRFEPDAARGDTLRVRHARYGVCMALR